MFYSIHTNFIITPIIDILTESVVACQCVGDGLETQPLSEYIMQSTFLRMTGALEQKMKCVCWELATNDYIYRYAFLNENKNYGEYSDYKSKNKVYSDVLGQIKKYDTKFDAGNWIENKEKLLVEIKDEICKHIEKSVMVVWAQPQYEFFKGNTGCITAGQICTPKGNLFESALQEDYRKFVYTHRNRCAHNLTSYQENLPLFDTLMQEEYRYENYFYRYNILIVLDKIFILLYKKYLDMCCRIW